MPADPAGSPPPATPEHQRLAGPDAARWRVLGPYLSERAWGTVREDYSANGDAWGYFPHDHARSRAYRWSEDGLAGICDLEQRLCLALALWNGRDPILKERLFGLANGEGNHGEDAKEYWWYLDATPTASWLAWRYHYPQAEFPYARLREENARRTRAQPEFELLDTGAFADHRYWQVTATYAKAAPWDLCLEIRVRNAGPQADTLHVLPTLWFRNRWAWDGEAARPEIMPAPGPLPAGTAGLVARESSLGELQLAAAPGPDGLPPGLLFCDNDTNLGRIYGAGGGSPYPKDGIHDHVVHGSPTVNPARRGTKAACWYRLAVPAGATVVLRLRLAPADGGPADLADGFTAVLDQRRREADQFYGALAPADAGPDERQVLRQAFAGLVWSQQFYHYDVARWLDGDPAEPPPPGARRSGRNAQWRHLCNRDIIVMPDKWEYPWYAAWDTAFHCVALAHVNPAAAKHQLMLLLRDWYLHPNGQVPAYEWAFGDVNPPIQAWAALAVFRIDGGRDHTFLARVFHKLLINFTWWVNRKDALGNNVFEGGFLGLDNIGPFDRNRTLPGGALLEQSDATAWMAKFCLNMLEMALRLAHRDRSYEDMAVKFFEHFAAIATAMDRLWDEQDGFYYDQVCRPDGTGTPLRARSMVGLLPLFAAVRLNAPLWESLEEFRTRIRWFIDHRPAQTGFAHHYLRDGRPELISLVGPARLGRLLARMLDEGEFLSPYGLRSLSRWHAAHPLVMPLAGGEARLDYEPGESRTGAFGGNSNWRGPVWFPLNFLAVESLRHLHGALGDGFTVELPTGSGRQAHLGQVADEIQRRLLALFLPDGAGRRPALGGRPEFRDDPAWRDALLFHEYFHGDTGEGLGASHQTGWTALAGVLVAARRQR